MDYAEFMADLPAEHLSFSCVEENEEVLKRYGVTQEERQLGAGRFHADLSATSVAGVELYSDRFDTAVSLYCQPPEKSVALLFTRSAEGEYHANGLNVSDGGLVIIPDGCGPDIVANTGAPIRAPAAGKVSRAGRTGGLGIAIYLSHGRGVVSRFGHLSKLKVRAGQKVQRGAQRTHD